MITHVTEISTPPTPADPPTEFEQKAAKVWSELHQAVPQMNQQADEIEQIGADAQTAKERAIQESDAALGYRNETRAARDAALPAAVTATDMAAQAVTAKEQTEEARDEAQAAAASAANRVAKTSDTGAALLPEGNDAQRPATGSIPAGALVMRGNTQTVGDYIAEYWDRGVSAWMTFASRIWVGVQITAAINALQTTIDGWLGFAIIYPNGGSQASPAYVSANTSYVSVNPFPGFNVTCEAQVFYGGVWSAAGWFTNNVAAVGVVAHQKGNEIVTIAGQTGTIPRATIGGNAFGNSGADVLTPVQCRVLCRKVKGAF